MGTDTATSFACLARRVSKASTDGRKYWVLEELNTKPAITYRKKVSRDTGAGA